MIVYHGTFLEAAKSIETDGVLLSKCKSHTDFGKGFYVSPNMEYAKNTALKKSKLSKKYGKVLIPVVVKFEYDENKGKNIEHHFEKEDTE